MLLSPRDDLVNIDDLLADASKEESAIDEMVALRQLYGLAEDEIMIVEGS